MQIIPVETTDLSRDYTLFDSLRISDINPFKVYTYPEENHSLCGDLFHYIQINGESLDMYSRPVAFDESGMRLIIYSETKEDIGLKNLTISAAFGSYPDRFKSKEVF